MLLTRRSLKDSCSAVFKWHVAGTMQNFPLSLFTWHVTRNLSSFSYYFKIICRFTLAFFELYVARTFQNPAFADNPCKILLLLFAVFQDITGDW